MRSLLVLTALFAATTAQAAAVSIQDIQGFWQLDRQICVDDQTTFFKEDLRGIDLLSLTIVGSQMTWHLRFPAPLSCRLEADTPFSLTGDGKILIGRSTRVESNCSGVVESGEDIGIPLSVRVGSDGEPEIHVDALESDTVWEACPTASSRKIMVFKVVPLS